MAVIAGKSRNAAGGPVWRPLSRAVGKLQVAAILGGALFRYAQSRPMGELQGSRYHRHYRAGTISASWGTTGDAAAGFSQRLARRLTVTFPGYL